MKSIIFTAFFVFILIVLTGYRIIAGIQFDRNCEGYLQLAATANTIPLARSSLEKAVSYLEYNNMTSGYTSIVYRTPDEDIGFFYNNVSSSLKILQNTSADANELTVSNTLLKLHNSLIRQNKEGESVIVPSGISIFPANQLMAFLFSVTILVIVAGVIWCMCENG